FQIGRYFERPENWIDEWLFSAAPKDVKAGLRKMRTPRFRFTLADWLNWIAASGLSIEEAAEPYASPEVAAREPKVADTRIVAYFLHMRCRKASSAGVI